MKLQLFLITSFLLFSNSVRAEVVDATSAGLAGNTIGVGNTAFSSQTNPASMTDINRYSFVIPLSGTINFLGTSSDFNSYFKDMSSFYKTIDTKNILGSINTEKLFDSSAKNKGSYFINNDIRFGNLGISGNIFSVMGKTIYGGINTWSKVSNYSNTVSPSILELNNFNTTNILDSFKKADEKNTDINTIIEPSQNLFKSFDEYLKNQKFVLPILNYDLNQDKKISEKLVNELKAFKNDVLSSKVKDYQNSITDLNKSINSILDLSNTLSELKNFKTTNVVDGHTVVAFSTASNLFKNSFMELSLGFNLKGFFIPYNPVFNQKHEDGMLGINNSTKNLFPLNVKIESNANLDNTKKEITTYYDNNIKKLSENSKKVSDKIKQLDSVIPVAIDRLSNSQAISQGDINVLKNNFSTISKEITEVDNLYNNIIENSLGSFNSINKVLVDDLSKSKFNIYQIEEISNFGFGTDIGLQAKFGKDLIIGIVAENPFVLWQSKIRKSEISFDTSKINFEQPLKISTDNLLKSMVVKKGTKLENFNYTLSEPFLLKVGGSFNLSQASTFLKDTTISLGLDQFFDGRSSSLGIALEKGLFFKKGSIFLRAGTQLGGSNNMTTFGLGAKSGSFRFDVAYGSSNLISLFDSRSALFAFSSSFSY